MVKRYRICSKGFAPIEIAAVSLRAALEQVHPNVRRAFEYAQCCGPNVPNDRSTWAWCTETV